MNVVEFPKDLNLKQAAEYCASKGYPITAKTLSNKLWSGDGPECVYRFGRPFFRPAALERWINDNSKARKAYSSL